MNLENTKPVHLDFAATHDDSTIIIVKGGKIALMVKRGEAGQAKFDAVLDALTNQQSLEAIKLIAG